MLKNSKNALIVAILLLLTLTGCTTLGSVKPQPIELPLPPACMAPVTFPAVEAGMDARASLAQHRVALKNANGRLDCSRKWYSEIRKEYAKQ